MVTWFDPLLGTPNSAIFFKADFPEGVREILLVQGLVPKKSKPF